MTVTTLRRGIRDLEDIDFDTNSIRFSTDSRILADESLDITTSPLDIVQATYCANCSEDLYVHWTPWDLSLGNIRARMLVRHENPVRLMKNTRCPHCQMMSRNFLYAMVY